MPGDLLTIVETNKRLDRQLEERRSAAEELRAKTESSIAGVLALTDEAVRIWKAMWEAALAGLTTDRPKETEMLRWALENAGRRLDEVLGWARQDADRFERPLAGFHELEARAAEFSLWARECLARWQMLDQPAPTLDRDRVARAQAAYARGEHEDLREVLSRVQAG